MSSVHEKHIMSRQRVAGHGEVYTPRRIVNAMLDLVKSQTERIDSRDHGLFESIVRPKEAKDA